MLHVAVKCGVLFYRHRMWFTLLEKRYSENRYKRYDSA